ncbi:hypothetical protein R3P38DRAFT_3271306, partial [Favolaschia claudopus]
MRWRGVECRRGVVWRVEVEPELEVREISPLSQICLGWLLGDFVSSPFPLLRVGTSTLASYDRACILSDTHRRPRRPRPTAYFFCVLVPTVLPRLLRSTPARLSCLPGPPPVAAAAAFP